MSDRFVRLLVSRALFVTAFCLFLSGFVPVLKVLDAVADADFVSVE